MPADSRAIMDLIDLMEKARKELIPALTTSVEVHTLVAIAQCLQGTVDY